MAEVSEQEQIAGVVRRLAAVADLPPAVVESAVRELFDEWQHARVRDFVPIFVERAIRERLDTGALAD